MPRGYFFLGSNSAVLKNIFTGAVAGNQVILYLKVDPYAKRYFFLRPTSIVLKNIFTLLLRGLLLETKEREGLLQPKESDDNSITIFTVLLWGLLLATK
ncbi:hypothetical protein SDJN03_08786, partial [Cucurbita argyrosperma subsp. sororia]